MLTIRIFLEWCEYEQQNKWSNENLWLKMMHYDSEQMKWCQQNRTN